MLRSKEQQYVVIRIHEFVNFAQDHQSIRCRVCIISLNRESYFEKNGVTTPTDFNVSMHKKYNLTTPNFFLNFHLKKKR